MKKRLTMHNGRKGKAGAFLARHNDRDNVQAAHIDPARTPDNITWSWNGEPFKNAEKAFYKKYFAKRLERQNEKYRADGHRDRCKTVDALLRASRTCPEECLYYVGNKDETVDKATLVEIIKEQVKWERKQYPQVAILDIAIHVDEQGAPHAHIRRSFIAIDADGLYYVSQRKCLEQMGIERPDPEKETGRHNNAKMTYTQKCREHLMELCRERGIEIEEKPKEKEEVGLSLKEYKKRELEKELSELETRREKMLEMLTNAEAWMESAGLLFERNMALDALTAEPEREQDLNLDDGEDEFIFSL